MSNIKDRWFTLDEKSLHQQGLFWFCLITPFVFGVIVGIPVWCQYDIGFNYQAYDFFMQISKLPLSIMALSPIATAFVVNAHKTIQTSKQISLLARKNTQDEFYSHYKYMIETILSQSMTVYVIHDVDFSNVVIAKGSEVNLPRDTPKFTFSCRKPQRVYSFVFNKCSPQKGVSFEKNTQIIDYFKVSVKDLALFCLFDGQQTEHISVTDCINKIKSIKLKSLSITHFNQMMFFISSLSDTISIESESIIGMDMDIFMSNMDNKSITIFAMEILKLYLQVINYVYEDVDSDFLCHSKLAIDLISLFKRSVGVRDIPAPSFI